MEEQFEKLLSETQNMILRILKENFTLSEISDFVGLSQEEVIKTVKVIADKRKLFFENV
jgi:DNA-binding Lrp family transcriptional regulator